MQPGCVVRFRQRDWVLLPGEEEHLFRLRPLTGAIDQVVEVHKQLANLVSCSLREETLTSSQFPPPVPDWVSDATAARLLWQAARLALREGAAPLRCLGRISIRPRTYQFVPLLMALRLDPVRLFIADDVGVGKTIEALLVARELLDRGEVRRLAVLCPPYLCDQWERELREKFNLPAVVVRSSTIAQLERAKPPVQTIYEYYPIQVISIDWVKSQRNKSLFLQFCPELVIVDEAHGAAQSTRGRSAQQQRHQLLKAIAEDEKRHLILLTATPHSGIEEAFRSLLGLLRPDFAQWDIARLSDQQRRLLAQHFVQRTRRDILQQWEGRCCFPERLSEDETYTLSKSYRKLFDETFQFCSQIVHSGKPLQRHRRRVRYWAALSLLRCVMSSPAAAVAALQKRAGELELEGEDVELAPFVLEADEDHTLDEAPLPPIEAARNSLPESDQQQLKKLARLAARIHGSPEQDAKLQRCLQVVKKLLQQGFHPILWCRFVPTADYLGRALQEALGPQVQVVTITGRIGDEERRIRIAEIDPQRPRVLVATDCLSEGINLQEKFTAVLHYDLPWNPNRLEQREGRVDRYGQPASKVRVIRFYGQDNPVDGALIEVLLNKAREIHQALGTYVPIPEKSETVIEAVLNSLFRHRRSQQRWLFEDEALEQFHRRWQHDVERERTNRTRFAQRALKPQEVQRELEAVDQVLGDPAAVREFVLSAAGRLNLPIARRSETPPVFSIDTRPAVRSLLPPLIQEVLPPPRNHPWIICFDSPTPEGAEYIGRNHPLVAALAQHLLEEALTCPQQAVASRCGAIRTRSVKRLTTLLLLRVRYLLRIPERPPLLSEEVLVTGYCWQKDRRYQGLEPDQALVLFGQAQPQGNIPKSEKQELLRDALEEIGPWPDAASASTATEVQKLLESTICQRAAELEENHRRIRKAVSLKIRQLQVQPQFPPDLLGVLVLQPVVDR